MKVVYIYRIALLCIMTSAKLIALRFLAVESAYLGLSPQLDMGVCIFLYLLQDLTGTIIFYSRQYARFQRDVYVDFIIHNSQWR